MVANRHDLCASGATWVKILASVPQKRSVSTSYKRGLLDWLAELNAKDTMMRGWAR